MAGQYADDDRCQEFVEDLEQMLRLRGWEVKDLAAETHYSASTIYNIMSYQRKPTISNGAAIDRAFKLKAMFQPKARAIQEGAFSEAFEGFPEEESTAHDLLTYQHSLFPGLLQTEEYMREVQGTVPNITPEDLKKRVDARLRRQEVLYRAAPPPPRLCALLDEAALRRPVGDAAVMYKQLMKALEVSELPHVSIGVVPYSAGGHIGLSGACDIVERDGVARVVFTDDLADGQVSEAPTIVRRVAHRFRALQLEALPPGASRDMIARLAEELWNR